MTRPSVVISLSKLGWDGAARDAALANRQAMMDAATQKALGNDNGGFENTKLPLDYSSITK